MDSTRSRNKKSKFSFMTLLLAFLVGIMLTLPFKAIHDDRNDALPDESRIELANRIIKLEDENDSLKTNIAQLRERADGLEEALMEKEEASTELVQTRTRYRILAGLDPVHGPGIRLSLSEDISDLPPGTDISAYIIHQEDLLNIVNELWLAGAEAIAIGGGDRVERLVLDSSIRCVGSLIDVNNTRMTPPFEIFAIGNSTNLYHALTMPGGVLQPLSWFNINYEIELLDDLELPAYGGSTIFEFAKPVEQE